MQASRWWLLIFAPASRVWVGWLGLFSLLVISLTEALAIIYAPFDSLLRFLFSGSFPNLFDAYRFYVVLLAIPFSLIIVLVVTIVATAIMLTASKFGGVMQKLPEFVAVRAEIVKAKYASLSTPQRYLHLVFWVALVAVAILWSFVPVRDSEFITNSLWSDYLGTFAVVQNAYVELLVSFEAVSAITLATFIGFGASAILFYALLISSLTLTVQPTSAKLLKRVFYCFAISLVTFLIVGIFSIGVSHIVHPWVWMLLTPSYLLLAVILPYLYFQRARLAEFGKSKMRVLALGGVAAQPLFWEVFEPHAIRWYAVLVLFAVFFAVAWAVILLGVKKRTKVDWGLFALICAVQVTTIAIPLPGVISV